MKFGGCPLLAESGTLASAYLARLSVRYPHKRTFNRALSLNQ